MASLKKALSKIKHGSRSSDGSTASSSPKIFPSTPNSAADGSPRTSTSSDSPLNGDGQPMSKHQLRKHAKKEDRKERHEMNAARDRELASQRKEDDARAAREEPAEIYNRYGTLPINQSKFSKHETRVGIRSLSSKNIGERITFQARIHTLRKMSARLVFLVFRQQMFTIQGVLEEQKNLVTAHFVQWAEHLEVESIVRVVGVVQNPQQPVKGSSVHDAEISVQQLHVISHRTGPLAFSVYEAQLPIHDPNNEETHDQHIPQRTRLANRVLDLRTPASLAIFRVNSGVCNLFRSYLDSRGFIEIHTPKLQGGATESGASVFQVEYFGRPAFVSIFSIKGFVVLRTFNSTNHKHPLARSFSTIPYPH